MIDDFELGSRLFGTKRAEEAGEAATSTVYATAVGRSEGGAVEVHMGDDVVAEGEDWDDDGNQVSSGGGVTVEIPTSAAVEEGDTVTVTLTGGTAKSPAVTGNVGWGDRVRDAAEGAEALAAEAQAVASATGQHFWHGDDGAHVTEATREEWEADKAGSNILVNSLGILLRKALANLASVTEGAVAFFDGFGNSASNIVASFGRNGATIGKADGVHMSIDANSLDVSDQYDNTFLHAGLANDDATGLYTKTSYGWPGETQWDIPLQGCTIDRVAMKDMTTGTETVLPSSAWTYDGITLRLAAGQAIPQGSQLVVTYSTSYPVPAFTSGMRLGPYQAGEYSAVLGQASAPGYCAVAEGRSALDSDGEEVVTTASGEASHAEGKGCSATARGAHAGGMLSSALADCAFAHGHGNVASGRFSFAAGHMCMASGDGSVAVGSGCKAAGMGSMAVGFGTVASADGSLAAGAYNVPDPNSALAVGAGSSDTSRFTALDVTRDGAIRSFSDNVQDGAAPEAATSGHGAIHFFDRARKRLSYFSPKFLPGGLQGLELGTLRSVGGSNVYHGLNLMVDSAGSRSVVLSDADAWNDALRSGIVYEASKGGLSLAADVDAYTNGASVTLPAGTYVLYGRWTFSSTSSAPSATAIGFGSAVGVDSSSVDRRRTPDSYWSAMTSSLVLVLSAQTTVYVSGACSVARTGCSSLIRAVRIR